MTKLSKAEKLPEQHRYFNISVIWIAYYRWVLRLLYRLRIPHEAVTLFSILSGVASAWFYYQGQFLPAALLLHFKDVLDACDGALARLTGRGHLLGRYLDSVGDFAVLTLVMAVITLRAAEGSPTYLFWGPLAILSTFIQCSFFNYYQLSFQGCVGSERLSSRRDERRRADLQEMEPQRLQYLLTRALRALYLVVYSWQDSMVAAVDNHLRKRCPGCTDRDWYDRRGLLVAQSALCFGTHIFVLIAATVFGHPEWGLVFIATAMNLYLAILLSIRRLRPANHRGRPEVEENLTERKRV
jgi:phosphatidylglycerophosphate synthase